MNNDSLEYKVGDLVISKQGIEKRVGTIVEKNVVPYHGIQGFEPLGIKNSENKLETIYNVMWSDSSLAWHLGWEIMIYNGR